MARQPVHIVAARAKPSGRQVIWQVIRSQPPGWSLADLVRATDIHKDTIKSYLSCLLAGRYVEETPEKKSRYRLIRDVGAEAPRLRKDGQPVTQGQGQEQMWRTMKMLSGDWTARDLAHASTIPGCAVDLSTAKTYVKHLLDAGYLLLTVEGKGGDKRTAELARYRFNPRKNTGPRAPQVQRVKTVWDPNMGQIMYQESPHDD